MLAFQRGFGKKAKLPAVGKRERDFDQVTGVPEQEWKGFRLGPILASVTDTRLPGQDESGLIVRVMRDGLPEVIHWHLLSDGRMLGALLDSQRFFWALFPILLGVSSGSLLVPSLALLSFRENSREIRMAQQRVSFVNQVSHELKAPLTNIRLYAEMARGVRRNEMMRRQ